MTCLGLLASILYTLVAVAAAGLTNSGRMTPECIIGLVINLGVGMGDELASPGGHEAEEVMMTWLSYGLWA